MDPVLEFTITLSSGMTLVLSFVHWLSPRMRGREDGVLANATPNASSSYPASVTPLRSLHRAAKNTPYLEVRG